MVKNMEVSLMPCVSQKHSPSGWRRAPYKQRVQAPESASTPETFHFLYPKTEYKRLPFYASMRFAKSGSFSYAQRVMTCATMVSPS